LFGREIEITTWSDTTNILERTNNIMNNNPRLSFPRKIIPTIYNIQYNIVDIIQYIIYPNYPKGLLA